MARTQLVKSPVCYAFPPSLMAVIQISEPCSPVHLFKLVFDEPDLGMEYG